MKILDPFTSYKPKTVIISFIYSLEYNKEAEMLSWWQNMVIQNEIACIEIDLLLRNGKMNAGGHGHLT